MKTVLLSTILSSLISHGTGHEQIVKPSVLPEKCPSVSFISYAGLDHVTPIFLKNIEWIGISKNFSYDTSDKWTLFVLAESERDGTIAIKQLTKGLSSLKHDGNIPVWDNDLKAAICLYEDEKTNTFAMTMSPALYS